MIEKPTQNFKVNGDIIFSEKTCCFIDDFLDQEENMPFYIYHNEDEGYYTLETCDFSYCDNYLDEYNGHTRFIEAYLLKDIVGIITSHEKKELNCDFFISNPNDEQYIIRVYNNKVSIVKLPLDDYLFEEI